MKKSTRLPLGKYPYLLAAALLFVMLSAVFADNKPGMPADKALALLKAGNLNFVKGKRRPVNFPAERRQLLTSQHPYAILLTCSDSRVPPELVFDESLGRLFIVRVAGNVTDPVALGSIEYAVSPLGAKLLVVLGHESCGAVEAALKGGNVPPHIDSIVRKIQPAADRARSRGLDPQATFKLAIKENVREQMANVLKESDVLRRRVEDKSLTIAGGIYSLKTGKVDWLEADAMDAAAK